jgi:V/A-type H+/Na+-transporting ATPase subunit E
MEEIVSTDVLEKEILGDARKKAERILKDADAESETLRSQAEARTKKALDDLASEYASRAGLYRVESLARLPLEKTRIKVEYADRLLRGAINEYLAALDARRRDAFIASLLSRASSFVKSEPLAVRYRGLDKADVGRILSKALPNSPIASETEDDTLPSLGIMVKTADLGIQATLDLVGERLADMERGELAKALCGEALSL